MLPPTYGVHVLYYGVCVWGGTSAAEYICSRIACRKTCTTTTTKWSEPKTYFSCLFGLFIAKFTGCGGKGKPTAMNTVAAKKPRVGTLTRALNRDRKEKQQATPAGAAKAKAKTTGNFSRGDDCPPPRRKRRRVQEPAFPTVRRARLHVQYAAWEVHVCKVVGAGEGGIFPTA